ncbi:hypothetical protein [Loigolactobacillus bifermentans]|nr:hypothetical protein [Loigolactobacillus bifermentans]QGG60471.1 hypothetical protein LB003_08350 [Loigolactobacillus bifermentans]
MTIMATARTVEIVFYLIYALTLVVLWQQRRTEQLFQFITCSLLGITLELFSVNVFKTYHYNPDFLVNIGNAQALKACPLWVGLGWGLLMPLAIAGAKKLDRRPLVTGLIAYVIVIGWDFVWDVLAIRTAGGLWVWHGAPINFAITIQNMYGIPWMNYLGYSGAIIPVALLTARHAQAAKNATNGWQRLGFALRDYLEAIISFIVIVALYALVYHFVPLFAIVAFLVLFIGTLGYIARCLVKSRSNQWFKQADWAYLTEFGGSYLASVIVGCLLGVLPQHPWLFVVHVILLLMTLSLGFYRPAEIRTNN